MIFLFDTQELIVVLLCLLLAFDTTHRMFSETSAGQALGSISPSPQVDDLVVIFENVKHEVCNQISKHSEGHVFSEQP